MKAHVREVHRSLPQGKKRIRAYSAFIYKAHKEVIPLGKRSPDFLPGRLSFPRPVMLRLVSSEASRLSKINRLKVITTQELKAAVTLVQQRINARAAA